MTPPKKRARPREPKTSETSASKAPGWTILATSLRPGAETVYTYRHDASDLTVNSRSDMMIIVGELAKPGSDPALTELRISEILQGRR